MSTCIASAGSPFGSIDEPSSVSVAVSASQGANTDFLAFATPPLTSQAPTPISCETPLGMQTLHVRRASRKSSQPTRSSSWTDCAPGIVFKLLAGAGTGTQGKFVAAFPRSLLPTSEDLRKRSRSYSVTCMNAAGEPLRFAERRRRFSADNINVDESDGSSDQDSSTRESASAVSGQTRPKKVGTLTSSLAHLVPNRLLMRVSRRVSSQSSAEGCRCTSCSITVTPYWRDGWAEDVMLCNACGLRFQKFAQRCFACNYIPRKEDNVVDACPQCQATWEC